MGEKINFKMPENALGAGIDDSGIKRGMEINCPEYHFGVVLQNDKILKVFDKKITITAKEIPGIKLPLFGKRKSGEEIRVRFYPYGINGNFIANNLKFTLKNGKRAKATFTLGYSLSFSDTSRLDELYKFIGNTKLNDDGSVSRPKYFNNDVVKHITNELCEFAEKGENWKYVVDPESRGIPREAVALKVKLRVILKKFFENIGYTIDVTSEDITEINFDE